MHCWSRILLAAAALTGCIRPPAVTLVDRRTALEEQAAGEYRPLEDELARTGATERPAALTRAQIEQSGGGSGDAFETVTRIYSSLRAEGDLLDDLLVRRCVGEAGDGTLVETPDTCRDAVDSTAVGASVARVNRDRRQLWAWMAGQRSGSEDAVRKAWRRNHLAALPCGAQVQDDDGGWEVKRCDG